MNSNFLIYKYSKENYYSKKEIKEKLKNEYSEKHWLTIINYRENNRINTNLPFWNGNNYLNITLTQILISKEVKLNKEFILLQANLNFYKKLLSFKNNNDDRTYNEFIDSFLIDEILSVGNKGYKLLIDKKKLEQIFNGRFKAKKSIDFFYLEFFQFLKSITSINNNFSLSMINLNKYMLNSENDLLFREKNILLNNKNKSLDSKNSNLHYGFNFLDLKNKFQIINEFYNAIRNEYNIFSCAFIIFYYIHSGKFFEKYNTVIAIAAMYTILSIEYVDCVSILQISKIILNNFAIIQKIIKKVDENNGDLNYLLYPIIDLFFNEIKEKNKIILKRINEIVCKPIDLENNVIPNNQIIVFARNLLKINPKLTFKQAKFCVSHYEWNKYYSISDYKKYSNSCYETSRYSLSNLVKLGYYKKFFLKRKFVYKPCDEILFKKLTNTK